MIRKTTLSIVLSGLLFLAGSAMAGGGTDDPPFTYAPAAPKPGDRITVRFLPTGQPDVAPSGWEALVYAYGPDESSGQPPLPRTLKMKRKAGGWAASFSTDRRALGLVIAFRSGESIENGSGQGFAIPLCGRDGRPVAGCSAGLGEAYSVWGFRLGLKMDYDLALTLMEKEFASNPGMKDSYLGSYLAALAGSHRPDAKETLISELNGLEKKAAPGTRELRLLADGFKLAAGLKVPGASEKAERRKGLLLAQAPALKEYYDEADRIERAESNASDPDDLLRQVRAIKSAFPRSRQGERLDYLLCQAYLKKGDWSGLDAELRHYFSAYRASYWRTPEVLTMLASVDSPASVDLAEALASKTLNSYAADSQARLISESHEEWKYKSLQEGSFLTKVWTVYGAALSKKGKKAEAVSALGKAYDLSGGKDINVAFSYAMALQADADYDKAAQVAFELLKAGYNFGVFVDMYAAALENGAPSKASLENLEHVIVSGAATEKAFSVYKALYPKVVPNGAGLDERLKNLEEAERSGMREDLAKKMINMPAPDFTLEDLEGRKIALSELRGKVVILDFWATWCSACIGSFPAMNDTRAKYRNDPDVVFLFVDTMEERKDARQFISDWLIKKGFPFHVLLDTASSAARAYNVTGIPAKFVIDKNGTIRFQSLGYYGNPIQLMKEFGLMIDMVR